MPYGLICLHQHDFPGHSFSTDDDALCLILRVSCPLFPLGLGNFSLCSWHKAYFSVNSCWVLSYREEPLANASKASGRIYSLELMIANSVSLHLPSMYHVPGTVLSAFHVLAHQILPQHVRQKRLPCHVTDEKTEAQERQATC